MNRKDWFLVGHLLAVILCWFALVLPVSGAAPGSYVALTFDDGPSGRFTTALLDGLQQRDVKATFALCGYRIAQYPELTQRIVREGHEIACHGYSHKNMQHMPRRQIGEEVLQTIRLLPENCRVRFLRPPGGCCSDSVVQLAKAQSLAILSWSVDPRDWASSDVPGIERAVLDQVHDGDIILLHDLSQSSVTAALDIIDRLKEQGYRFATVSQLAAMRGYTIRPGQTYSKFPKKSPQPVS